jgi:hypothetical protein
VCGCCCFDRNCVILGSRRNNGIRNSITDFFVARLMQHEMIGELEKINGHLSVFCAMANYLLSKQE